MGKPSPPAPPDPKQMAQAQYGSNVNTAAATARLGAVNQNSPYGSVAYNPIGYDLIGGEQVPQYEQTITLSPEQQTLYNSATGLEQQALNTGAQAFGNAQSQLGQPFSLEGLPPLTTQLPGANDFGENARQTQEAYLSRFRPDWERQRADTESRLAAQGLQPGTEAWNTQMDVLGRQWNDAQNQAIQAGNAEQSRLLGIALQNAAFGNQGRQQAISEATLQRNQPLNELSTLLGLGSNVQAPTGAPNFGVSVSPTNVLGAYGMQQAALQNNYNQQMGANNALWGGLSNLGGAALGGYGQGKGLGRALSPAMMM